MHILQKQILDALRMSPELRYSQLQPRDIESSHFKYHLTQLQKAGLVEQVGRGVYKLTVKGVSAVDRLSEGRVNPYLSPKVITYVLLRDDTNYYLLEKSKDPYRGLLNMIGGKLHLGETNLVAAHREVAEKTGMHIDTLSYCGVATVRITSEETLISHVVAHVFCSDLLEATDISRAGLVTVAQSSLPDLSNPAPDLMPIVRAVQAAQFPFVIELDVQL